MTVAERVQQYRIAGRRQTHRALIAGPFAVLLHPTDDARDASVAIPLVPPGDAAEQRWHEAVRSAFVSQGRIPAIQWVADYAPHLAATLRSLGFSEYQRETLLVCAPPPGRLPPVVVAGLTFVALTDASPLDAVRENLDANEFGFDPAAAQPATDEQAARFRATLHTARAFTARLHGHPAGAGMYTTPLDGVTELVGIATLEQYRGRGIAAALTAHMASAAFAQGCDLAFLTTASPAARRAYEHAGFTPIGDVLTYAASEAGVLPSDASGSAGAAG